MDAPRLTGFERVRQFTLGLDCGQIPPEVRHFASLLLLDTLGVAAAAKDLEAGRIARGLAARSFGAGPARRAACCSTGASSVRPAPPSPRRPRSTTSMPMTATIRPRAISAWSSSPRSSSMPSCWPGRRPATPWRPWSPATRWERGPPSRSIGTVSDYHSSGAWNALAVVATGARLKHATGEQLREALGIAEYHGPRGQMMRVIDNPTMVHDGSAFGALAGATALGAGGAWTSPARPAITVEAEDVDHVWQDLGKDWAVARHYIKPYPVCRWTHALIDGALLLKRNHAPQRGHRRHRADELPRSDAALSGSAADHAGRPVCREPSPSPRPW